VAERLTTGIQVAASSGPEQAIPRAPTSVTAFIGRTLRGPVSRAVRIGSFADFQAIFGGLWQPSTLSYAVEQFFDNGGKQALIVRVVNGARPPTLELPAGRQRLKLEALAFGTREYLRASVDYDGIGDNEEDAFNLVLQRVRAPGSEHVEDQEIFRRLSINPENPRYVPQAVLDSTLARMEGPVPTVRPDRTLRHDGRGTVGYVQSLPDGDDGAPITDYDVIGSARRATGLFALGEVETFNFLCIPPLARETDVGASTLLVAGRLCRDRRAMLIVDPPATWKTAMEAVEGLREWPFRSENALMYFPRLLSYDRLRGRFEQFAPCGAVAGMLARADESWPVWSAIQGEEPILRPGYRPELTVAEPMRLRLMQLGINVLQAVRSVSRVAPSARTLAGPSSGASDWKYLAARRLALFIVDSIERGTRWVVFETNGPALWLRVFEQIDTFLAELDRDGAFVGRSPEDAYLVVCDQRINAENDGTLNILFGFAAARAGEFHSYLISHQAAGSRVRQVTINRLESAGQALVEEMEELP